MTAPETIARAARDAADVLAGQDSVREGFIGKDAAAILPVSRIHVTAPMGGVAHTTALLIRVLIQCAPAMRGDATRDATAKALRALATLLLRLTAPEETNNLYYVDDGR